MMEKLDNLDKKILNIVMENARIPSKDIAAQCGVSRAAIHQRIQRLIGRVQAICSETLEKQVGRRETVLVESVSLRDEGSVGGKTPRGHMVNFPGNGELIGKFGDVEIVSAGRNTLRGRMI